MKGKLHKMVSGYILSLNGDIDDPYAIVNKQLAKDHEWHRLSLKNCQAIERGYDLDELAYSSFPNGTYEKSEIDLGLDMYKLGFQKALELMGDKKFSEKDLRTAYGVGYLMKINPSEVYHETLNGLVQLLQQTEWDVEIVEECLDKNCDGVNKKGECITTGKPKLDSNNCLILKKL